jgi:hypothetical protein
MANGERERDATGRDRPETRAGNGVTPSRVNREPTRGQRNKHRRPEAEERNEPRESSGTAEASR